MADIAKLGGYILGVLIVGRLVFLWCRGDDDTHDDATFFGVVAGVLWPLMLAAAIVLSPFYAIGWAISRPTRRDRRASR